jgi:hypothetical protein
MKKSRKIRLYYENLLKCRSKEEIIRYIKEKDWFLIVSGNFPKEKITGDVINIKEDDIKVKIWWIDFNYNSVEENYMQIYKKISEIVWKENYIITIKENHNEITEIIRSILLASLKNA